jgi:hypothetical protein
MPTIQITPEPDRFRAVYHELEAEGATAGEALDALTAHPDWPGGVTMVLIASNDPDRFFTADQQRRLRELMDRWRAAGRKLPASEQAELDALVQAEVKASADRTADLLTPFAS